MSRMQETRLVRTRVEGDPHTLILDAPTDTALSPVSPAATTPTDAVAVTFDRPEQLLEAWSRRDERPRNLGVVGVGERMRSAAVGQSTGHNVVRGVPDPTDLEAIRDATTAYMDAWPDDGRTAAYVDSVTALLEHADRGTVTDFLASFVRTLDARGTVGYFRLIPALHDRATVCSVTSLFDTVVEAASTDAMEPSEPSVDDCFEALASEERRAVLLSLAEGEETTVSDVADRVAEGGPADRRRVAVSLTHVHLPKLAGLGLLAYDRETGRAARGPYFDRVAPLVRTIRDRR